MFFDFYIFVSSDSGRLGIKLLFVEMMDYWTWKTLTTKPFFRSI